MFKPCHRLTVFQLRLPSLAVKTVPDFAAGMRQQRGRPIVRLSTSQLVGMQCTLTDHWRVFDGRFGMNS
jgi:hypothetical protein